MHAIAAERYYKRKPESVLILNSNFHVLLYGENSQLDLEIVEA